MGKALTQHAKLWAGFALLLALSVLLMWSPQSLVLVPNSTALIDRPDYLLRSFMLPLAIVCFAVFLNSKHVGAVFILALSLFVGGCLSFFLYAAGAVSDGLVWEAFSFLFPAGCGGLYICFFLALADLPREELVTTVLVASAAPAVIVLPASLLLDGFMALAWLGAAFVAFLVLSILLMRENAFDTPVIPIGTIAPLDLSAALDMVKPLICIVLCTLVVGMLRTQSFVSAQFEVLANNITYFTMFVSVLLLVSFARSMINGAFVIKIYNVLLPTTALLYLLLPLADASFNVVLFLAVMLVFFSVSPLTMIMCAWFSREYGLPRAWVYGVFSGLFYASSAAGSAIGLSIQTENGAYETVQLLTIALVAIWLLVMVVCFLGEHARKKKEGRQSSEALSFDDRIDCLQSEYGLSEREREVMELVARGRSAAFIAESLFISKSTVQSHCKSVYKKMGIHSKQELISVVNDEQPASRSVSQ